MKLIITIIFLSFSTASLADTYVKGHLTKNGTYVEPHYRSDANNSRFDNYSTKGNTNPYTGQQGNNDPYELPKIKPYNPPPAYQYKNPYDNN